MRVAPSVPPSWGIASAAGTTSPSRVPHPWDSGSHERNWSGYFIPGTTVLRNKLNISVVGDLRDAENDLVEARLIELREVPELLGERTYDLAFFQAIHRHLFQDVYAWAGDLRTVGIEKGRESFCPPLDIPRPMAYVARRVWESNRLAGIPPENLLRQIAHLYDYVNFAHPFREGNGRATREFFDLLLSETGVGLDWQRTDSVELHNACHVARSAGDLAPMENMFARIIDSDPAYEY